MRRTLRKASARGTVHHQIDMAWGGGAVGVAFSSKPEVSSQYIGPRVRLYRLKPCPSRSNGHAQGCGLRPKELGWPPL